MLKLPTLVVKLNVINLNVASFVPSNRNCYLFPVIVILLFASSNITPEISLPFVINRDVDVLFFILAQVVRNCTSLICSSRKRFDDRVVREYACICNTHSRFKTDCVCFGFSIRFFVTVFMIVFKKIPWLLKSGVCNL